MILLYANNVDVTENLGRDSLTINEQLNNRVNTCSFRMDQLKIPEGQRIEFFEYLKLTEQTNLGSALLHYDQDFEFSEKFRPGDEILINIKESNQFIAIIDSIDHDAKTITLTENVSENILQGAKIGRKIFGGTTMKNPDEEIGNTGSFSYRVTASDYTEAINRKIVVDTFEDQYLREIISRIVYRFTASDFEQDIETFETAWTESGVALAMVDEGTDKIQGNYSQKTGMSGAGVAKWTQTISTTDFSSADSFKLWFKIAINQGANISDFKFRIGQDSSNYFEMSCDWIGSSNENCWSLFSFLLKKATIVGSPDLSVVDWVEIEMTSTSAIPAGSIYFDHAFATGNGFSLNNTKRGLVKFADIRIQYKKFTVVLEEIAKLQNDFWFVDYERDIHFFSKNTNIAPFSLSDDSENFGSLKISADISQLKNRQTVRGGKAPSQGLYAQERVVDGEEESWRLDYPPKDLKIYTDTGAGYVEKTVGIENLVSDTSVDYVFNFNEKTVRRGNDSILASGNKIKLEYYPYKDIRVQIKDNASIAAMKALVGGDGIFDGAVITDTSIKTFEEARKRASAEVRAYSNAILSATFTTEKDGLTAGQIIHIKDTQRNVDADFLIQKVKKVSKSQDQFVYTVTAGSTMFGIIEFFQLLLKRSEQGLIDVSEIVDVVTTVDEVIVLNDSFSFTKKNKTFQAGDLQTKYWDFIAETGNATSNGIVGTNENFSNFYADFVGAETGSVSFDESSNYNDTKALKIETEVGGTGKSIEAKSIFRIPVKASTEYNFSSWLEIPSDFTNQGASPGAFLSIKEFAAKTGGSTLATNTLINGETSFQDFNKYQTSFTTNASTNFIELSFKIKDAIGIASISDIILAEQGADSQSNPGIASFSEAI